MWKSNYKAISKDLGLHRTTVRTINHRWRILGAAGNLPRNSQVTNIRLRLLRNYSVDWWDKSLTFWKVYVLLHVTKTSTPTIKHGNGFVMVWGCFTVSGPKRLAVIDRLKMKVLERPSRSPNSSQIEMLGMTSNRSLMFENPVMWLNY